MASIEDFSDEGKFSIKIVSQKTGIQAVTIRAWENRYQLLEPPRAANGYRLYSERDIAVLNWVKKQVDGGTAVSSVVHEFKKKLQDRHWPDVVVSTRELIPAKKNNKGDVSEISRQFTRALIRMDERMASEIFNEVLVNVNLSCLFESMVIPALVEIGKQWEKGEISVSTEHFASSLIRGRIEAIYQSLPLHSAAPKVLVGCAPDELHEIGSLMFAVLLRDAGYNVEYLGPDIPLDDLLDYAGEVRLKLLIISATLRESALKLIEFAERLKKKTPASVFGYAGAAFILEPELYKIIPGLYLGNTLTDSLSRVSSVLPLRKAAK